MPNPFDAMLFDYNASASTVKLFGADLKLNGSALSTYNCPFQHVANRCLSTGCTGTMRLALFILIFAIRGPGPT